MPGWSMFSKAMGYIEGLGARGFASPVGQAIRAEFKGGRMAAGTYGRAALLTGMVGAEAGAIYGATSDDTSVVKGMVAGAGFGAAMGMGVRAFAGTGMRSIGAGSKMDMFAARVRKGMDEVGY
jgi:hypothetical protein